MNEGIEGQGLHQENKKPTHKEVPERLAVGQNLYDQEPFQSIGEKICDLSEGTLDVIRRNISYLAREHLKLIAVDPKAQTVDLLKKVDLLPRAFRIPRGHRVDLIEALQHYPYWSEYIVRQRQNYQLYDSTGKFIQNHNPRNNKLPLSYANWIIQEDQRKRKAWLFGIEKVFPERDHPATSLPNTTGVKPTTGRYRTLKAANIARYK